MPDPNSAPAQPASLIVEAHRQAGRAASAAGVRVEEITDPHQVGLPGAVFDEVWGGREGRAVVDDEMLRVFAMTGQYLVIARDTTTDEVLGASAGLLAAPIGRGLHSHITGVRSPGLGRGLGMAIKVHQRAWALERGLDEVTWTFDPLIRRNAHFNLVKLGAQATAYLPDFYGEMQDEINAGDHSDRLFVTWHLTDPVVAEAIAGRRPTVAGDRPRIGTPSDIETLRRTDPAIAAQWRQDQRAAFLAAFSQGRRVIGLTPDGEYVLSALEADH